MKKLFATTITCMDGRIQKCVNEYVSAKTNRAYVDTITLAGPSKVISENKLNGVIDNLKFRLDVSINQHDSNYIAIVGHHDCAGVIESDNTQKEHIKHSCKQLQSWYPNIKVEALWVNEKFEVEVLGSQEGTE